MNEAPLNLGTTAEILKQSWSSLFRNLYTFVFLSLVLFSFRTSVENGTFFVTTLIDRDPSLKALLSHLDLDAFRSQPRRRRPPFLHLSRVGTLDENFFSGEDDDDAIATYPSRNKTSSLSHFFRADGKLGFSNLGNDDDDPEDDRSEVVVGDDSDSIPFSILGRRDAALLLFLVSFLSAAYGWAILGFLIINSCVLGIVFYTVVGSHLGKHHSFLAKCWVGSRLGIQRLSGFILIRWAVRDAMTQLIGICFFAQIDDQHSFFKLFVRLKLMPFSGTYPWITAYDSEVLRFLVTWTLSETALALVFAVDYWVAIMDARSGKEIVKEGFYLLSTMLTQAVLLKAYEAIFCGAFVRSLLAGMFGNMFATIAHSVVEIYFMVVWLIYYFAAKCKDAHRDGRRFDTNDLEDYINGLR